MAGIALSVLLNRESHIAPSGHLENVARLFLISQDLDAAIRIGHAAALDIEPHGLEPITRIHTPEYVNSLREICRKGSGHLDMDTYFSDGSFDAAITMADASLSSVDLVFGHGCNRVFVLGRPPGHHAERDHAKGFCLLNNVAIAAQYAIDAYDLRRVAVVDFDVHHGNGTQHSFYDRADVLFTSLHRYPFYPGTGGSTERGSGSGEGYTLNIPLCARASDDSLLGSFRDQVVPALEKYEPELLIVSAGFDSHQLDPIGGLCLTDESFLRMGEMLRRLADCYCGGKIVSVLEGGYSDQGNRESISSYLDGLGYD